MKRLTQTRLMVLRVMLSEPERLWHGYDLATRTGLGSGSIAPMLLAFAADALVLSSWEDPAVAKMAGRGARHFFQLNPATLPYVRQVVGDSTPAVDPSRTVPRAEVHAVAERHGDAFSLVADPPVSYVREMVRQFRLNAQHPEFASQRNALLAEAEDLAALADRHEWPEREESPARGPQSAGHASSSVSDVEHFQQGAMLRERALNAVPLLFVHLTPAERRDLAHRLTAAVDSDLAPESGARSCGDEWQPEHVAGSHPEDCRSCSEGVVP